MRDYITPDLERGKKIQSCVTVKYNLRIGNSQNTKPEKDNPQDEKYFEKGDTKCLCITQYGSKPN